MTIVDTAEYMVSGPSGTYLFRLRPHWNAARADRGEAVIDLLTNPEGVRVGSPPDWLPFAFRVGAGVSVWNKFRGVYRLHGEAAARLFRHTGALRQHREEFLLSPYGWINGYGQPGATHPVFDPQVSLRLIDEDPEEQVSNARLREY